MKKIILIFALVLTETFAFAQELTVETSLTAQQMTGDYTFIESDTEPIKLEVESFMGYGFQAGMNIGKFNMGIDFIFGNTGIVSENSFDVAVTCFYVDFEYSFLQKPLSPCLVAGIGSVNYTESFTSSAGLNENDFSYHIGAGVKWIIAEQFYIKPLYRLTGSKIEYTTNSLIFHGFNLGIGYIFTPKMFRK